MDLKRLSIEERVERLEIQHKRDIAGEAHEYDMRVAAEARAAKAETERDFFDAERMKVVQQLEEAEECARNNSRCLEQSLQREENVEVRRRKAVAELEQLRGVVLKLGQLLG